MISGCCAALNYDADPQNKSVMQTENVAERTAEGIMNPASAGAKSEAAPTSSIVGALARWNSTSDERQRDSTSDERQRDRTARVYARKQEDVIPEPKQVIVIDPGHTAVMSGLFEPVGPGSSEMKAADTMGTRGVVSGVTEYELNLEVSQKLKAELERRGYEVILTRQSHDLSLSCIERAAVANEAGADVFIRIHADGSESQSAKGALTICITPDNPYCPELYEASRKLSDCVLEEYCRSTGAIRRGVWETDTMTGNNWSQVPVTLIELGFMTNPDEDLLMETEEYQEKMVIGIADGIDRYLTNP